jgi:hypothetical protein
MRADRPAQLADEDRSAAEGWYNPHRRHSALGQISPARFERSYHEMHRTPQQSLEHDLTTVGACMACAAPPVDKSATQLTDQT